jgi:hypothetical protein
MRIVYNLLATKIATQGFTAGACHLITPFNLEKGLSTARTRTTPHNGCCHGILYTCSSVDSLLFGSLFTCLEFVESFLTQSARDMKTYWARKVRKFLRQNHLVATFGALAAERKRVTSKRVRYMRTYTQSTVQKGNVRNRLTRYLQCWLLLPQHRFDVCYKPFEVYQGAHDPSEQSRIQHCIRPSSCTAQCLYPDQITAL